MSVLAIKDLIKTTVTTNQAAIIANTGFAAVVVFRQAPKLEKLGNGFNIILGPWDRREARRTNPRGGGQKQVAYRMHLMVEAVGLDEQARGDDFDTAIENLQQALRSVGSPQIITDPITSAQTALLELAEEIESRVAEPVPGDRALVRFIADVFVSATETIVG